MQEVEQWNAKQEYKSTLGKDPGFTDYSQLAIRKYMKITDSMQPVATDSKLKTNLVDKLAEEVRNDQKMKRFKFSKQKAGVDADEDVTFINERNMRFNKKVARFYDKYTKETYESLERGTAID